MAGRTERERGSLDRATIVAAAIRLVDEHSLAELSMRRLGETLGVEAMSLYHHIPGREALLDAMVDAVVADIDGHPHARFGEPDSWQAYLQELAHDVRDVALAHPKVFPLVATRHPDAPWLRPPLRTLRIVEDFLEALTCRGVDDDTAVEMYRAFSSFLLGHLLLLVASLGAATGPAEEPLLEKTAEQLTDDDGDPDPAADIDPAVERLAGYPNLQRLEGQLAQDHTREEFEAALENLLERLELMA